MGGTIVFGVTAVDALLHQIKVIWIGTLNGNGWHEPLAGSGAIPGHWAINVFRR